MKTWRCNVCKKELPETLEFYGKKKGNESGLQHICRSCRRESAQDYYNKVAADRREETKRILAEREKSKMNGIRLVTFPPTWKPNREGMQSNYEDKTGIASSLDRI